MPAEGLPEPRVASLKSVRVDRITPWTCAATFWSSAAASPGLRAALSLAEAGDVVMLTKADPRESNTGYAQGGIAAAIGADDSPELHARDTIAAGDGLCVPEAVDVLVRKVRATSAS